MNNKNNHVIMTHTIRIFKSSQQRCSMKILYETTSYEILYELRNRTLRIILV